MKFKSARGGVSGVSFEEAVLCGRASDGGFFVPESFPQISREQLKAWSPLSYPQLVEKLLRFYVEPQELSDEEIKEVMEGCYSRFSSPEEVIRTADVAGLVFAELWHGPTGAFKDLSLAVLGRVIQLFLERRQRHSNILIATSGDTGSAAIHSALGMQRLRLFVMYPRHMVSRTQELQMTTVQAPNATVFSMDSSSDDADDVITKVFADREFACKHNLTLFNSPNVCRMIVQSMHFIYLYLRLCPEADQDVLFCVPTGGLGNIASGMMVREMGLPIKFLAAVNENDTVLRTLDLGVYEAPPTVHRTSSCAMDICVPYNMERIFYYFSGRRSEVVRSIMTEFEEKGVARLPESIMEANTCISAVSVEEGVVISTMRRVWEEHGYLICPHTAVAAHAALDLLERRERGEAESVKTTSSLKPIVICTATPNKFAEAAKKAGLTLPPSPMFDGLEGLPEKKLFMNKGEDWAAIIKREIERVNADY